MCKNIVWILKHILFNLTVSQHPWFGFWVSLWQILVTVNSLCLDFAYSTGIFNYKKYIAFGFLELKWYTWLVRF